MFNTFEDIQVNQNINMLRKFLLRIAHDPSLAQDHYLRITVDGQAFVSEPSKQPSIEFSLELSSDQNPEIAIELIRDKKLVFTQVLVGKFRVQEMYSTPRKYLSYKPDGSSTTTKRFFYVSAVATHMKIEKGSRLESGYSLIAPMNSKTEDNLIR